MGVRFFPGAPNDPMIHPSFWPHPNKKKAESLAVYFLKSGNMIHLFGQLNEKHERICNIYLYIYIYIQSPCGLCQKSPDRSLPHLPNSELWLWLSPSAINWMPQASEKRLDTDPGWSRSLGKCFFKVSGNTQTLYEIFLCVCIYMDVSEIGVFPQIIHFQ